MGEWTAKRDEDGDHDGDVDEDDHPAMITLPIALRCHQERGGEVLPLVLPPRLPPLVLGLHGDDGPSEILLHGLR